MDEDLAKWHFFEMNEVRGMFVQEAVSTSAKTLGFKFSVFKLIANPWHSCPAPSPYKSLYKSCTLQPPHFANYQITT